MVDDKNQPFGTLLTVVINVGTTFSHSNRYNDHDA